MKIIGEGNVTNGKEGTAISSCTFPGVCVMPGGRMAMCFKGSPKKGPLDGQNGYVCHSGDMGETWGAPVAPFPGRFTHEGREASFRGIYLTHIAGARVLAVMPAVYEGAEGTPYYNEATEGILDTDIFFAHSDDYGHTFTAPRRMETGFFMPVPLTGPVILLPDGRLMCQFELNKKYDDLSPWVHSSVVIFSRDGGHTWGDRTVVTKNPSIYYWDQRIGLLNDGRLLDLFWTFDRETADYLTIHARDSLDGISWSPIWDTGLPGQPGQPASAGGGRTAVIYIDRSGSPKISVKFSADNGHTFLPGELTVYDSQLHSQKTDKGSMNDAWAEMSAFSVGHPNLAALPGGLLYAYYYAGGHTDRTDIRWAKISAD